MFVRPNRFPRSELARWFSCGSVQLTPISHTHTHTHTHTHGGSKGKMMESRDGSVFQSFKAWGYSRRFGTEICGSPVIYSLFYHNKYDSGNLYNNKA